MERCRVTPERIELACRAAVAAVLAQVVKITGVACDAQVQCVFNQYVNPIGLENLQWKFYFLYIAILVFQCLVIYFYYVETKGPTLEEIAVLFDGEDANVGGNDVQRDEKAVLGNSADHKEHV